MYHRIAQPESDVWEISVSEENFENQLQILKEKYKVVSLETLIEGVENGRIADKSIAITFDDGYLDNYLVAKPLLEKYQLPATFFICSGNIESNRKFWWDELEQLILFNKSLPNLLSVEINGVNVDYDLKGEAELDEELIQKHKSWKACSEPSPTKRSELFYKIWEKLKLLTHDQQQECLAKLRSWAAVDSSFTQFPTITKKQISDLAISSLFHIQAHTVSHPSLPYHSEDFQKNEMETNVGGLKKITGKRVEFIAYPFGNYNEITKHIAQEIGFKAAFTTDPVTIDKASDKYSLGRFQVYNQTGKEFEAFLDKCYNS